VRVRSGRATGLPGPGGGSLLLFAGERLVGGTGRYEGATGNVRSRDRAGGSDIVITIHPPR
jgi:hypothetical protein